MIPFIVEKHAVCCPVCEMHFRLILSPVLVVTALLLYECPSAND